MCFAGTKRQPIQNGRFGKGQTVAVVLNLDANSPNKNTIALYRDGKEVGSPVARGVPMSCHPAEPEISKDFERISDFSNIHSEIRILDARGCCHDANRSTNAIVGRSTPNSRLLCPSRRSLQSQQCLVIPLTAGGIVSGC